MQIQLAKMNGDLIKTPLYYRNSQYYSLFNLQPYRLQSEQFKQKAISPPESRRPNSKASKAKASSATGQSRGHSSRRYPFTLVFTVCLWGLYLSVSVICHKYKAHYAPLGVVYINDYMECDNCPNIYLFCVYVVSFLLSSRSSLTLSLPSFELQEEPEAAGTSEQERSGLQSKSEATRWLKRSEAPDRINSCGPTPSKKIKLLPAPRDNTLETKKGQGKSKKRSHTPEPAASLGRGQTKKNRASGPPPVQKRRKTDSVPGQNITAGSLHNRTEGRTAKPSKLASKSAASAKAGCSNVTESSSSSASTSSSSSTTGTNSTTTQGARVKQGKDQTKARRSRSASSPSPRRSTRDKEQAKASSSKFEWAARFNPKVNLPKPKLSLPGSSKTETSKPGPSGLQAKLASESY